MGETTSETAPVIATHPGTAVLRCTECDGTADVLHDGVCDACCDDRDDRDAADWQYQEQQHEMMRDRERAERRQEERRAAERQEREERDLQRWREWRYGTDRDAD